jgi:hypothetical protein
VGQDREHPLIASVAEGERAGWFTVDLDGKLGCGCGDLAAVGDAESLSAPSTPSWAAV